MKLVSGQALSQVTPPPPQGARDELATALWALPDAILVDSLRWAGLGHLAPDAASLLRPARAESLSGGEQQRFGGARLKMRCSTQNGVAKPRLLLLDEPTSACEAAFEEALFELIAQEGIGALTIAHADRLEKYHTHQLVLGAARGANAVMPL